MKNIRKCLLAIFVTLLALPFGLANTNRNTSQSLNIDFAYGLNLNEVCDYDQEKLVEIDLKNVGDISTLPEQYNMTEDIYIQVEDQKQYGICWSFSSLTTLETYFAKQYREYYQFSAIHQATAKFVEDNSNNGTVNFCDASTAGGNIYNFLSYISHSAGPVLEEQMPFDSFFNASSYLSMGVKAKNYYNAYKYSFDRIASVDNVILFADATKLTTDLQIETNRNAIKQHLIDKGACSTNIYMPNTLMIDGSGNYYLPSVYGSSTANHMVTIIGWNDNYSISGYSTPGAWLIQNSWGDRYTYFYVSYYDNNVENMVFGVESATLTTPCQNTISNVQNLMGFSASNFYLTCSDYQLAMVVDVEQYTDQYITGVYTTAYSNSSANDAYTYYLYFTNETSYQKISKPSKSIATASTTSSMIGSDTSTMYGNSRTQATFDTPQKITDKYAVLVVDIKKLFNFFCFYSGTNSSNITQKFYMHNGSHFVPPDFGDSIKSAIIPVFFNIVPDTTHTDEIGNFSTVQPEYINKNENYEKHNSIFVGNTLTLPVGTPSASIYNIKIYSQKYSDNNNGQLISTDYTSNFTFECKQNAEDPSNYDIKIKQLNNIDIQDYILSFNIGNKSYRKMFSVTNQKSFPITYYLAGGGINSQHTPTAFTNSTSVINIYEPSRAGYTFNGWYFDDKFSTEVSGDVGTNVYGKYLTYTIPENSESLTFYAKWELNAPSIITHPTDVEKIYDKNTLTLTVDATHGLGQSLLTYQWYVSKNNGATYSKKINATNSTLNLTNVAESGMYKCEVSITNDDGTKKIESNPAKATITQAKYKNLDWQYVSPYRFNAQQKEVKVNNNYPDDLIISYTGNKATNAGEYTATASIANKNENYETPTIEPLAWTINKAKLTVTIKSFDFETQEGFDNFTTNSCKSTITGQIFNLYTLNIVYKIESTSNPNLKTITADYTKNDNYDVTIINGQMRLIRFSMSATDEDTTISIKRENGYLIDATLKVETLTEQDLEASEQKFLTDKKLSTFGVYKISIDGDNSKEEMNVSISINPDLWNKNLKLYMSTANGLKLIDSKIVDGNLTFNTNELGTFVIVEAPEDLVLKDILIGGAIVLGAGLLVCIFIGILQNRRKKKLAGSAPINTPH